MGWIIFIVVVGGVAWWLSKNSAQPSSSTDSIKMPEEILRTVNNPAVPNFRPPSQSDNQKINTVNDPWLAHCMAIEEAWARGDYDWARMQLQKIAYGMVEPSVTDAQRADFTRLMTSFAKEDPLYKQVMERVLPLVRDNPGMLQSQIYKGQPDEIKEQMRYVLYFANELGHIRRIKKGNSYQLML